MQRVRKAFETNSLTIDIATLRNTCVGCRDCNGVCFELLELAQLPDFVLRRRGARA